MRDFIERLKAKPEHVRRRIALGTSLGITGVVATAWFFTLLFAGTLSLAIPPTIVGQNATLADQSGTDGSANAGGPAANVAGADAANPFGDAQPAQPKSNLDQLLGAVGISTAPPAPAALQVEDAAPTTTAPAPEPTVIPF
jgi:hypothetical protein